MQADSSSATRSAITRFSLQVWTNSRYFWRFSKKRKLPLGSRFSGGTSRPARRRQPAGGGRDIGLDAVQRIDGDALALAQAMHQLAVVDRPAPERRLRHVGLTAELGDLAEDWSFFIGPASGGLGRRWAARMAPAVLPPSAQPRKPRTRRGMIAVQLGAPSAGQQSGIRHCDRHSQDLMRRAILILALLAAALWSAAFPCPIARAARTALHHRHHAGRSADRRLQQDHRAEGVFRREARDHLFLARSRLEQEGQLHAGDRGRRRSDPPAAERRRSTICAARPITTRASTTSPSPISTTRCGWARRAASSFTTAAMPGAPRANTPRRSPTTMTRSSPIRRPRFPGRTAASRNRRSAISTARWPTSTKRSGSTRHCRSP